MPKSILVDAYFLTDKSADYSLSFTRWTGGKSDGLPMLFVKKVEEYYLYKVEVNQEVLTQKYGMNMISVFSMTLTDVKEGVHIYHSSVLLIREPTRLDNIIETDGLVTMSQDFPQYARLPLDNRSCLFRFKSPLIVVDNV